MHVNICKYLDNIQLCYVMVIMTLCALQQCCRSLQRDCYATLIRHAPCLGTGKLQRLEEERQGLLEHSTSNAERTATLEAQLQMSESQLSSIRQTLAESREVAERQLQACTAADTSRSLECLPNEPIWSAWCLRVLRCKAYLRMALFAGVALMARFVRGQSQVL